VPSILNCALFNGSVFCNLSTEPNETLCAGLSPETTNGVVYVSNGPPSTMKLV
jgi:hypothetical protein